MGRGQKRPTFRYAEDKSTTMRQVQEPLLMIADSSEESLEKMLRNKGYKRITKVVEGKLMSEGF